MPRLQLPNSACYDTSRPLWVTGLRELPAVLVLNTFIGIACTFIYNEWTHWWQTLLTAHCIGLCIHSSMLTLRHLTSQKTENRGIGTLLLMALTILFGIFCGDTLAGLLVPGHKPLILNKFTSSNLIGYLVFGFVGSTISVLYFGGRWMLTEERRRAEQALRTATEAQLRALQAQVEPHFLFNTLANLDALIALDPKQARVLLSHLNRYLRNSLTHARRESCTLGAEIEQLRAYLAIMEIRLPDRFRATIDCPPECAELPLAPMLLQPLIENAIKHGIEPSANGGEIQLITHMAGSMLEIEICDSGIGLDKAPTQESNNGTGINNVRERLRVLYGEEARLTLTALPERGTCVLLQIPLNALTGNKP